MLFVMIPHNMGIFMISKAVPPFLRLFSEDTALFFEESLVPFILYKRTNEDYLILLSDLVSIVFGYMTIFNAMMLVVIVVRVLLFLTNSDALFRCAHD